MPKYSTGDSTSQSSSEDATACELCGQESSSLTDATVAGAHLSVCKDCNPHDDAGLSEKSSENSDNTSKSSRDRKQDAIKKAAESSTYLNRDTSRWEKNGANYEEDQLPYMATNYGSTMRASRQEKGITQEELAEAIQVEPQDIELMESGQIRSTSIKGSDVAALEEHLKIRLSEQK